jgi:leucyl aminopeptidase
MTGDLLQHQTANPVFFCWKESFMPQLAAGLRLIFPHLEQLLKANKFTADVDQLAMLSHVNQLGQVQQFFFAGLGASDSEAFQNLENLRRAISWTVARAKKLGLANLAIELENSQYFAVDSAELVCQVATALQMADYEFSDYKQKQDAADCSSQCEVAIFMQGGMQALETGLSKGLIIAESINWTRRLADMPPNHATPVFVAERAREMAEPLGLAVNIFGPSRARELNMGGFLAVQAGSEFDGQFIELEYKSGKPSAKKIVLVGKGVTFDTGGVSLKPANSMKGMKYDMSGAATVLGVIQALAKLKPDVDVVAIAPMVENMPGGGSCRQDDVIVHYNGLSTEIENTDAEGRLILADALAYAVDKHQPAVMIDIATLTGACVVALGHFYSGLMSNNQPLADRLLKLGKLCGDWLWQMPMHSYYKKAISSNIADQSNCGAPAYGAGAITAAKFLESFVGKTPWAHIDIAGTENAIPDSAYASKLSSGVGVRLLVDFVLSEK